MIPKETVEKIYDALRIEEVVGDFVSLKKKGADYKACCPFHNEKTPSFSVSTTKGIYKCFGCGEGGNAIDFVMKHETFSYPEALRYLADKYGIEIVEKELSLEEKQYADDKESLYIVHKYALNYFKDYLFENQEGKEVGLSYLRKRGYTDEIINKFQLGYCPSKWDVFSNEAQEKGYKLSYLKDSGLTKEKNGKLYDGFRGRVMFPIFGVTGKCIGFGGRILNTDTKAPKYLNSPETAIYIKNKVLYGIFEAKKAMASLDNCFLVEGYTDVISFFQAGIENVVASSGTSLTEGQIKLIKRFTNNITILYDGDVAGIKASFRGIDLILAQGLNVKVVLFPEGEDPDSMAKKLSSEELKQYVKEKAKDFIVFKSELLAEETANDPVKKSKMIHEIIDSIALIPDQITRSLFIKESSGVLDISETILLNELNKVQRKNHFESAKQLKKKYDEVQEIPMPSLTDELSGNDANTLRPDRENTKGHNSFEKDILRLILNYGHDTFVPDKDEEPLKVADFLMAEIQKDDLAIENKLIQKAIDMFMSFENKDDAYKEIYRSNDAELKTLVIELTSSPYTLADWERKNIIVQTEDLLLKRASFECIYSFKAYRISRMIKELEQELKTELSDEDQMIVLQKLMVLKDLKRKIQLEIGRPI